MPLCCLSPVSGINNEVELIKGRSGLEGLSSHATICPAHRGRLGIYWSTNTKHCVIPTEYAFHTKGARRHTGISKGASKNIQKKTGQLFPLGASICRQCYDNYDTGEEDESELETDTTESESNPMSSPGYIPNKLSQVSNSSSVDESCKASINNLSVYAETLGLSPVKPMNKGLNDYQSDKRKEYHVKKTSILVAGILKTIAGKQGDAKELYDEVMKSDYLKEELGCESDNEETDNDILLEQIVELYLSFESCESQTDLLDFVCHSYTFEEVQQHFELSQSTYYRYRKRYEGK